MPALLANVFAFRLDDCGVAVGGQSIANEPSERPILGQIVFRFACDNTLFAANASSNIG